MALSKTLAIALLLTAKTSPASAAIDKFSKDAEKKINRLKDSSAQWNKWGDSNIIKGAAMTAPFILAAKAAADLEDKIADVAKVANVDFGSKQFRNLENSAIKVSNKLGVSSVSVGELMAELAAGGVAANRLESIAMMAGKVGVAFDVTSGEAGKAFMTIQNAMNLTEKDTKMVLDSMNAATNKFGGKASELLNFMASGGASVANTLKVSGVHMQAFANAMQVVGIGSSEAATTMERFQKAVLTNANAAQIFNKAGGGTKGMLAILEKAKSSGNAAKWLLSNGFGEYSTKLAQLANNMDSGKGVKAQLKYLSSEGNVKGSSDKEFENRMKTTNSQLNILKTQATNAGVKLGSSLLPVISQLTAKLVPVIDKVSKWIEKNPKLTEQIIKGAAAFAVGRVALGFLQKSIGGTISAIVKIKDTYKILKDGAEKVKHFYKIFKLSSQFNSFARGGSMVSKVLSGLKTAFTSVGRAIMVAGKFLMANPIILGVVLIAGLVYLIIRNWDKIKPWLQRLWGSVTNTTKKAWNAIKGFFIGLWNNIKSIFNKALEIGKFLFLNFTPAGLVIKYWEPLTKFFSNLWEGVKKAFWSAIEWIVKKFKWFNDLVLKPLKIGVNFATNAMGGPSPTGASPAPAPLPYRSAGSNTVTFNPVIHLNGASDPASAQLVAAQVRRDFDKRMQEHEYNKQRRAMS